MSRNTKNEEENRFLDQSIFITDRIKPNKYDSKEEEKTMKFLLSIYINTPNSFKKSKKITVFEEMKLNEKSNSSNKIQQKT